MLETGPGPLARETRRSPLAWAFAFAFAALVLVGAWFRLTSLQTAPVPTGDEAIYGVLDARLLQGRPVHLASPSGHLLSPVLMALQLPFVVAMEPSYTALRLPVALAGILTVALTYWLTARAFDPPTALIASGLLAILPIAIIYSRIAWEPALVPLMTLILIILALQDRRLTLLITFVLGVVFVYLTLLMLAPILWGLLVLKDFTRDARTRLERWRSALVTTASVAAAVLPLALFYQNGATAGWTRATYQFGPPNLPRFLHLFEKMLLGYGAGAPTQTSPALDLAFWSIVALVLAFGSYRLITQRRWDRLTLVATLLLSLLGLNRLEGPGIMHPGLARYGLFLVVPSVLAFACLARACLAAPGSAFRRLQVAAMLGLGVLMLASFRHQWFDTYIAESGGVENVWTLASESGEQKRRIADVLLADMTETAPRVDVLARGPVAVVLAEDHWSFRPIEFFTAWRRYVKVFNLEPLPAPDRARLLREQLLAGAYVVGARGQALDRAVLSAFPPAELQQWRVTEGYNPVYHVYRLARPAPSLARQSADAPLTR